jgi:hypothetical protein
MSFVVAAIVNEPDPVLDRFVQWYLAQGATRIDLYFDDPAHPAIPRLGALARVTATPCTPAFWDDIGISAAARFTRRQNALLSHAYSQLRDGWLLNVDADELMYAAGTTLENWLQTQNEAQTIRVATAEYVRADTAEQIFRLPIPRPIVGEIYRDEADLFRRRFGLIGHADGKSFHRAGRADLRLRQHWSEDATGAEVTGARLGASDGIYLLHYIAQSYPGWRAKLDWRLGSHGFPEPIKDRLRAIQARGGDVEAGYRSLFDLLHGVTADQLAALEAAGGILRLPADFASLQDSRFQPG